MFGDSPSDPPQRIGFLLVPDFSMIGFASAIDALRSANRMSGRELYRWKLYSVDGKPVRASNGITVTPDSSVEGVDGLPMVIVCSGANGHTFNDARVFSWLRRLARRGTDVGALCTGSHILARAGLLDGRRCTIHWENLPAFAEEFPHIEVSSELFEVDRNRFTCAGGTAALDMMLHLVEAQHGHGLAAAVCDQLILDRIREGNDRQRMALRLRLGASAPKLISAITLMEANLEEPLSREQLARSVGLCIRQLERLFRRHLGMPPTRYYLGLRLDRARLLLSQTGMSVFGVALACGFVSASHFSKCYREQFGHTPRAERVAVH